MKDYLASKLSFGDWKKILRVSLPDEAENFIHAISRNKKGEYDRSYAAIRKLIETNKVANASQMETVVKKFHQAIAKKFREKFLEGWHYGIIVLMKFCCISHKCRFADIFCTLYFKLLLD